MQTTSTVWSGNRSSEPVTTSWTSVTNLLSPVVTVAAVSTAVTSSSWTPNKTTVANIIWSSSPASITTNASVSTNSWATTDAATDSPRWSDSTTVSVAQNPPPTNKIFNVKTTLSQPLASYHYIPSSAVKLTTTDQLVNNVMTTRKLDLKPVAQGQYSLINFTPSLSNMKFISSQNVSTVGQQPLQKTVLAPQANVRTAQVLSSTTILQPQIIGKSAGNQNVTTSGSLIVQSQGSVNKSLPILQTTSVRPSGPSTHQSQPLTLLLSDQYVTLLKPSSQIVEVDSSTTGANSEPLQYVLSTPGTRVQNVYLPHQGGFQIPISSKCSCFFHLKF